MTEEEAFQAALETLPRNDDGSVDEKMLIDEVAALIDFDEASERRNKAARAVTRRRKPGSTAPEGQLVLPGIPPYAYEPHRLVADNAGHVVEQERAPVTFKQAEAERARANADRQNVTAGRKEKEAREYAKWIIEQATEGRDIRGLGFDEFVREANLWRPGSADAIEAEEDGGGLVRPPLGEPSETSRELPASAHEAEAGASPAVTKLVDRAQVPRPREPQE